jgi:PadR family transcriptional regulator, regulatory protein PadR
MSDIEWPTKTELLVLRLLIPEGESYGHALVKKSDGALKRGTVYVTLGRMEAKGFLTSREEQVEPGYVGIPRRLYVVTGLGQRALQAVEMGEAMMAGNLVIT